MLHHHQSSFTNFALLCTTLVYICSTQINAQYFPQLRRLTVRPLSNNYQQQQPFSNFYNPSPSPPPASYYSPPPPPAFYSPPPPSYYSPPAASYNTPTYLPRNTASSTTSGTLWSGWNSLRAPSLFVYPPAVDVLSSSNYIAVVGVDSRGIRGTICQAGAPTQNSWTQLITGGAAYPIDTPTTTYYGGNLYTTFCGIDFGLHGVINPVSGTVITPSTAIADASYSSGDPSTCQGGTSSVVYGNVVLVFARYGNNQNQQAAVGNYASGALSTPTAFALPTNVLFGPTAATYTDSANVQHLVVAIVTVGGQLMYLDTTATINAANAATTISGLTFTQSQQNCMGPPVAVSLGTSVNIYCKSTSSGYTGFSVISNGGENYVDTVKDGYLPKVFDGVYTMSNVNVFATSEDGTIYTRILDQPNTVNTYTAPTYTAPYTNYYW